VQLACAKPRLALAYPADFRQNTLMLLLAVLRTRAPLMIPLPADADLPIQGLIATAAAAAGAYFPAGFSRVVDGLVPDFFFVVLLVCSS
jgi:hypothetical protein